MNDSIMIPNRFSSMFRVGRNAGQNIPSGVWTVIQWDFQFFDELNEITIVAPYTFIPALTGYYVFNCHVRINNLTVPSVVGLGIRLNGAMGLATVYGATTNVNESITLVATGLQHMTPNDNVDVVVQHNNGIVRSIQGNRFETAFFGHRVR